jgi:hypothetical protein
VLEAIKHDPDLFMKIMSLQAERGGSMEEIIEAIRAVNPSSGASDRPGGQRGMRDIPAERMQKASTASSDDLDDELYSETMAEIRRRLGDATVESGRESDQ